MTREEIVKAIDEITAELKKPMSDLKRALLHADRSDLRTRLAALDREDQVTP